ncbi:hypothetical protein D3C72_2471840 [compost metagenome]
MAPPSKFCGSEKTNSITWLAGSDGSALRFIVIRAVSPRSGTVICAWIAGSGLASPPGDSSLTDHATVPGMAVGEDWPSRSS